MEVGAERARRQLGRLLDRLGGSALRVCLGLGHRDPRLVELPVGDRQVGARLRLLFPLFQQVFAEQADLGLGVVDLGGQRAGGRGGGVYVLPGGGTLAPGSWNEPAGRGRAPASGTVLGVGSA
ncbi:hypothetical protein ACFQ1L_02475 [Phytohabitans flavus]|uniref:hypothetical protein n=1 Tax=Phytohabitans flavus TaxID=1076124 RepID=UPI003638E1DE